jgi:hypothetical protein
MITKIQFNQLDGLFDYYNKQLFDGKLNDCMINMSRKKGAYSFFEPKNWKSKEGGGEDIHEISLCPDSLDRDGKEWQATLVHEMVHLWQQDNGKPSRNGYHNKQWAAKMEEIGLIPSSTGAAGGKKTGQSMTHYIAENGLFIKAFNNLNEKKIKYPPLPKLPHGGKTTSIKSKTKYECPCGNSVWGKSGLSIICADCNKHFEQEEI